MKKKFFTLLSLILISSMAGFSQASSQSIPVFQGNTKIGNSGRSFTYAFAKGDKVEIEFSTEKDKDLSVANFSLLNGESLWSKEDVPSGSPVIEIKEEGVYSLTLEGKFLGSRMVRLDIKRTPESEENRLFNTAWEMETFYDSTLVHYKIDSVTGGYTSAPIDTVEFDIFDKYVYQRTEAFNLDKQLLGQYGAHKSQAAGYELKPAKVKNLPTEDAFFDHYYYTISSRLGGATHWQLAKIGVTAGALFLSPAGAFAAHGAMGVVGPKPGKEPVQYFMSEHKKDISTVKEIYSPSGKLNNLVGAFTNGDQTNEGDLSFDQKGKVTNLYVRSATYPWANWMIVANPERSQAKNTKLSAAVVWGAPIYNKVKFEAKYFKLNSTKVNRSKMKYTNSSQAVRLDM